jgi:hypothetical protein
MFRLTFYARRLLTSAVAVGALGGVVGLCEVALTTSTARASTLIAITLEDLVGRSERIVVAIPRTHTSRWESGRIVTYSAIEVEATIAGPTVTSQLVVRTLGGEVDGIGQQVSGEARLPLGAPVILFLRAPIVAKDVAMAGSLGVVAMEQGAMHIARAPGKVDTVRETIGSETLPPVGVSIVPAHVHVAGRAVSDVTAEIRAIVAAKGKK